MAERFGPKPLKSNYWAPNSRVPAQETKRQLWRNQSYLIVDVEDPGLNVSWTDRDLLRAIGERLYGKRKEKVA